MVEGCLLSTTWYCGDSVEVPSFEKVIQVSGVGYVKNTNM